MSSLLPALGNDFGARRPSHKSRRPVLVRADTLPSPPSTTKAERVVTLDNTSAAILASPPASSDVDMDSPRPAAPSHKAGGGLALSAFDDSPIQARKGQSQRNRPQVTPSPPSSTSKRTPLPSHLLDSPTNPFKATARDERRGVVPKAKPPPPKQVVYVFRGKKVKYDVPFERLMAPEDPSESPFPDPSPRLLFPPAPLTPPPAASSSSSSSATPFLDKLREAGGSDATKEIQHGLPTPARERDSPKKKRRRAPSTSDSSASTSHKLIKTNAFQRMRAQERAGMFSTSSSSSSLVGGQARDKDIDVERLRLS